MSEIQTVPADAPAPLGARPWLQLDGEPDPAYAAFLTYRNCGPARSITRAYGVSRQVRRGRKVPEDASGQWKDWARLWQWHARALRWDIRCLKASSRRVPVMITAIIEKTCVKLLDAALDSKVRPKTWEELMTGLKALAGMVSSEHVEQLIASIAVAQDHPDDDCAVEDA